MFKRLINKGFTLAEVLITLTIIGVVAALAIPSLIQTTQNIQFKSAAKEAVSVIMRATSKMIFDQGGNIMGSFDNSTAVVNALSSYMSVQKTCSLGNSMGTGKCYHYNFKFLNDQDYPSSAPYSAGSAGLILNNGMLVNIYGGANGTETKTCSIESIPNFCASIDIDVNGWKGPNKLGYDIVSIAIMPSRPAIDDVFGINDPCIYPPNTGWNNATNTGWMCISKILKQ